MSYLVETSNDSQEPEKNRREILRSWRDERNADLSSGVMGISAGVDESSTELACGICRFLCWDSRKGAAEADMSRIFIEKKGHDMAR